MNAEDKLKSMGYEIHPVVNLWARKCDITGEGMNSGYCIEDGRMYIKHESDMIKHLRKIEKEGNDEYDKQVAEGRLTDDWLLNDYYQNDYYYYTDWECNTDIQYAEVDGKMYEEGEPEFEMAITPYAKDKRKVTQNFDTLKHDIKNLFKAIDDNTTSLWRDDLECTHECIVIEDVEDGVKMDENDNPITPCKGSDVVNMINYITAVYLEKKEVTPKFNEDDYEYQSTKGDGVTEVWSHRKTGEDVYVPTEIKRYWNEATPEY